MLTLQPHRDGTELAFHDAKVTAVALADAFRLDIADADRDTLRVALLGAFEATLPAQDPWRLDWRERDDERLGRLAFALHETWLTWCRATERGVLRMVFENGIAVTAAPASDRDGWELTHERFRLAGVAGGSLAREERADAGDHARF